MPRRYVVRFNREVRPHLWVVPIGMQGIAFDRGDLDVTVRSGHID
jgi:hypothetical protein